MFFDCPPKASREAFQKCKSSIFTDQSIINFHNYVHHEDIMPQIFNTVIYKFVSYFIFNNEVHNRNIHLPRVDTGYGQKSVCYAGVNLWNNLLDDLKTITSFSKFKAHLKLYLQVKSYGD